MTMRHVKIAAHYKVKAVKKLAEYRQQIQLLCVFADSQESFRVFEADRLPLVPHDALGHGPDQARIAPKKDGKSFPGRRHRSPRLGRRPSAPAYLGPYHCI